MTTPPMPAVVAHRGASGSAPENTLAAFRRAAELGAAWIELDTRLAGDGTLVVMHDARVERTTDGRGRVRDLDPWRLNTLDAGSWRGAAFRGEPVPTLHAALDLAATLGLGVNVEIKADDEHDAVEGAAAVADLVRTGSSRPRVLVSSFSQPALAALRRTDATIAIGLLIGANVRQTDLDQARDIAATSVHADHRGWSEAVVALVATAGLWPAAYTVNDVDEATRLWRIGVRTVITDHPETLLPAAPQ